MQGPMMGKFVAYESEIMTKEVFITSKRSSKYSESGQKFESVIILK
jgi:hypothetical protein